MPKAEGEDHEDDAAKPTQANTNDIDTSVVFQTISTFTTHGDIRTVSIIVKLTTHGDLVAVAFFLIVIINILLFCRDLTKCICMYLASIRTPAAR